MQCPKSILVLSHHNSYDAMYYLLMSLIIVLWLIDWRIADLAKSVIYKQAPVQIYTLFFVLAKYSPDMVTIQLHIL